jgi:hypothetical protein
MAVPALAQAPQRLDRLSCKLLVVTQPVLEQRPQGLKKIGIALSSSLSHAILGRQIASLRVEEDPLSSVTVLLAVWCHQRVLLEQQAQLSWSSPVQSWQSCQQF